MSYYKVLFSIYNFVYIYVLFRFLSFFFWFYTHLEVVAYHFTPCVSVFTTATTRFICQYKALFACNIKRFSTFESLLIYVVILHIVHSSIPLLYIFCILHFCSCCAARKNFFYRTFCNIILDFLVE